MASTACTKRAATTRGLRRCDAGKAKNRRNLRRKTAERVVAAAFHELPCACVESNGLAPVEELVAGLDEQKVAFGHSDAPHPHRLELDKIVLSEIVALEGIRVGLRSEIGDQVVVRTNCRIDQHRS